MSTIHLVGLPHTELDPAFTSCAFTSKAVGFCRMMAMNHRSVNVYWGGIDAPVERSEFVSIVEPDDQREWFGTRQSVLANPAGSIAFDASKDYWRYFNDGAIAAVKERIKPGDIVAVMGGNVQQSVVDAFPEHAVIEPCAGYVGICRNTYVCFESYAWQSYIYGYNKMDGRFLDTVIPGYVDLNAFEVGKRADRAPYMLYLGRMTKRKGVEVAADLAEELSVDLVMAGTGDLIPEGSRIHYRGHVDGHARRILLREASLLVAPSLYVEPYGTVHAEALVSGVPVLGTDFGVYPEIPGVDTFRTFEQALACVNKYVRLGKENDLDSRHGRAIMARTRLEPERLAKMWRDWLDLIDATRDGRNGYYKNTRKGHR